VPKDKEALYASLVASAPAVTELEELEEDDVSEAPPPKEKVVAKVKGKKGKKVAPEASTQVTTRSYTRADVDRTTVPNTELHDSPLAPSTAPSPSFVAPSMAPSSAPRFSPAIPSPHLSDAPVEHIPIPCGSNITIPSIARKRRAPKPDSSATSSETPTTLSLIENVDMVDLIEHRQKTGTTHPAYTRIQEFLTKVCTHSRYIFHSLPFPFNSSLFVNYICPSSYFDFLHAGWCESY